MRLDLTQRDDERGWALVSVLCTVAVLTLLLGAAQSLSYQGALREHRALEAAVDDAVLDAAVVRAVLGITDTRVEQRWRVDGTPEQFVFGGRQLTVTVQDELGRIDLNAADVSLLRQLLQAAGETKELASLLADRIADWRQARTGLANLHRTSDDDYAAAGLNYRPRHAPFETVEELKLVLGMSPSLFAAIRDALTVYSHHPALDTAVAPKLALLAYYPGQTEQVASILIARSDSPTGLNSAGHAFEIVVTAPRPAITRRAEIMLTNSKVHPYLVLAWR